MTGEAPAITPIAWTEPAPGRPLPFWSELGDDLAAHLPEHLRGGSWATRSLRLAKTAVRSSGFHVTALYRMAHQSYHRLGLPGRAFAGLIFWFLRHAYGCSIAATARLYGGLILPHPQNLVIGPDTVVGPRAWIFQNVTLGGLPGRAGMPHVGRDARIFTGAVVVGPIVVGDNVVIGANSVVADDVPSRRLVRGPSPDIRPLPDRFVADG